MISVHCSIRDVMDHAHAGGRFQRQQPRTANLAQIGPDWPKLAQIVTEATDPAPAGQNGKGLVQIGARQHRRFAEPAADLVGIARDFYAFHGYYTDNH